ISGGGDRAVRQSRNPPPPQSGECGVQLTEHLQDATLLCAAHRWHPTIVGSSLIARATATRMRCTFSLPHAEQFLRYVARARLVESKIPRQLLRSGRERIRQWLRKWQDGAGTI